MEEFWLSEAKPLWCRYYDFVFCVLSCAMLNVWCWQRKLLFWKRECRHHVSSIETGNWGTKPQSHFKASTRVESSLLPAWPPELPPPAQLLLLLPRVQNLCTTWRRQMGWQVGHKMVCRFLPCHRLLVCHWSGYVTCTCLSFLPV